MIPPTALHDAMPPPTAARWPLVGALPRLLPQPFAYLRTAHEQHGDIFRLDLGVTDFILLNHPNHVQHILRDNARNYRKGGNIATSLRSLFGNGVLVSEGEHWLRQRRMMQPHFHRHYLTSLIALMLNAIDEEMAQWPKTAVSFDIATAFNRLTLQVIARTLIGAQLSPADFDRLREAMAFALDYMLLGVIGQSLPGWVPLPRQRRYRAARHTFDELIYQVIAHSRRQPQNNLLSMLLDSVDVETGERMTDEQVRDEIAILFVAGYETTAITLSWLADYLARDPVLQARLGSEIETAVSHSPISPAALNELELVKRTFQEALRLRPATWFVPRETVEADVIDGIMIPAGQQVALLMTHIHHHPDHWADPERFDPDRFLPTASEGRHPFAFAPFGAGQRQCIGREFAYMEGQLILARLLQRYRLRPVGPPARPQLSTTLRPREGVKVQLLDG